ncbi:hypothetical protein J3A83DRAFT_4375346 [Scleroderma citrinum]
MVQKFKKLQVQLDETKDEEEKWALEEDIMGNILWTCWSGISCEVGKVLPVILCHIVDPQTLGRQILSTRTQQLNDLRTIFMDAAAKPRNVPQIQVDQVMADVEAGVSKHGLLLTERQAAQRVAWRTSTAQRDVLDSRIQEATQSSTISRLAETLSIMIPNQVHLSLVRSIQHALTLTISV